MTGEPDVEPIEMTIQWNDATQEGILVTPLGDNRYRVEVDVISCMLLDRPRDYVPLPRWGDVVEAREIGPGRVQFVRVVERARMRRFQWVISRALIESPELDRVLSKIMDLGGNWERVFGGVVIVYLPRGCDYDLWADLKRLREP